MTAADERPEYSEAPSHRHASRGARSGKLRVTYFSAAALWGFLVGILALLLATQAEGASGVRPGLSVAGYLVPAAVLAVFGGAVIARAYRDAKRR